MKSLTLSKDESCKVRGNYDITQNLIRLHVMYLLVILFISIKSIPIPLRWNCPTFLISTECFNIPTTYVVHVTTRLKQPKSIATIYMEQIKIKNKKLKRKLAVGNSNSSIIVIKWNEATHLLGGNRALLHLHSTIETLSPTPYQCICFTWNFLTEFISAIWLTNMNRIL